MDNEKRVLNNNENVFGLHKFNSTYDPESPHFCGERHSISNNKALVE